MVKETFKHIGMREKLVKTLIKKGIKDPRVLDAISIIPRHLFLDEAFAEWAYKDQAFQIGCGQTISQPYTVARQTELLDLEEDHKVLEIGTGSGYQACVLALICKKVYSIERQEGLFKSTSKFLFELGYGKIRTLFGDGYKGSPRFAPFDRILITAAASNIPKDLFNQLKVGGKMVIPIGEKTQTMVRITKIDDHTYQTEKFGSYQFVPFLKGVAQR